VPVEIAMDAPARNSDLVCNRNYGRRPVIAVLDTGVRAHPWLDVTAGSDYPEADRKDGFATVPGGFVQVDQEIQDAVHAHGRHARTSGDQERQVIRFPWDASAPTDLLVKALDSHIGHGTFIAGIIRQIVPDATVLSIRLMHSDGIVYEGDLLCALQLIAARVAAAHRDNNPALMVDAVSLSLGYFTESPADVAYTSGLRQIIDSLRSQGVVVAAAAGNFATRRRFYPAAFAGRPSPPGELPLLSVGALNPNGSRAAFSDGGSWVTGWAPGAGVMSTFPADLNGDAAAAIEVPGRSLSDTIASLDSDDYRSGFAVWSGTSFAAPALAAHAVRAMLEPLQAQSADRALRLDSPGAAAAVRRAQQALSQLQRQA
jgi:subtilisin family serine protease